MALKGLHPHAEKPLPPWLRGWLASCCRGLLRPQVRFARSIIGASQMGKVTHGPLARYAKLRVAHAPGTFSPSPGFNDPVIHHDTCATHVPCDMPRSPTSDFLWSRWWWKRSRHSRRMRNPQFYISAKRPMEMTGTYFKTVYELVIQML